MKIKYIVYKIVHTSVPIKLVISLFLVVPTFSNFQLLEEKKKVSPDRGFLQFLLPDRVKVTNFNQTIKCACELKENK